MMGAMLNPCNIETGCEQYEEFVSHINGKTYVDYQYRHIDRQIFGCIRPTIEQCSEAKEVWIMELAQGAGKRAW